MAKTPSTPNLKKLKDLARLMPQGDKLSETVRDVLKASDHAAAMIVVAWLDHALKNVISMRFRGDLSTSEKSLMFDNSGPLSTPWSKIHFSYSLGIIGPITKTDLLRLNEIRKSFAHASELIDFETPEIVLACEQLTINQYAMASLLPKMKVEEIKTMRDKFIFCSLSSMTSLAFGSLIEGRNLVRSLPEKPERTTALEEFEKVFKDIDLTRFLP